MSEPTRPMRHQTFMAASGAAVVAAIVVNPLDVVKTRLQTQAYLPSSVLGAIPDGRSCPPNCNTPVLGSAGERLCRFPSTSTNCYTYDGSLDVLRKIVRREGAGSLWRGTKAALVQAIPTVGIYLPLYDHLLEDLNGRGAGAYAPLVAGSAARSFSVMCTAPLEVIRVQAQALQTAGAPRGEGVVGQLARVVRAGQSSGTGVRVLWTGLGASLARDVPFSAIYWTILEHTRRAMLQQPLAGGGPGAGLGLGPGAGPVAGWSKGEVFAANMASGMLGGAVAAAVTTPFDVVKTRQQAAAGGAEQRRALDILMAMARGGGMRELFAGVVPRAIRAAPACGIVISSYELLKIFIGEGN